MKVVVSYGEPDMDGVACMYAYSEFLNRNDDQAGYFILHEPKQEVKIVCDIFGIELHSLKEDEISENDKFVAVDLNGKDQMDDMIKIDNIVEIIDHHGISRWVPYYTSLQRLQIDRVGAAATIIAERYKLAGMIPSRESAILLYYGIISNSINLKASITNYRDIEICKWLKSVCDSISEEKIQEIFIRKSKIEDQNLRLEMECEIPLVLPKFRVIVAQLEVANLETFLKDKKTKMISIMQEVKKEKEIDYIFCNCVDILNGYINVIAPDENSKEFFETTFGYQFDNLDTLRIDKIIQRKEMTRILREKYYNG